MVNKETTAPDGDRTRTLLTVEAAQPLASARKSRPYWSARTPRWIIKYIRAHDAYLAMDNYAYRINQVDEDYLRPQKAVRGDPTRLPEDNLRIEESHPEGSALEPSFALYDREPKEVYLRPIQANLKMHSRVPTLYSNNFDQLEEQIDIIADYMYEMEENLFFNHEEYGILNNVDPDYRITAEGGPTPDLLDDMLSRVWIGPEVFVMHPEALQDFRTQASALSLDLDTVERCGGEHFTAWRGVPIFPSNKLLIRPQSGEPAAGVKHEREDRVRGTGTTHIVLARIGEEKQGIIGLQAARNEGSDRYPRLSVDFMGINDDADYGYLMSMYVAAAVLTPNALAVAQVTV